MVTLTVVFVISLQVHHVFNDSYCLNEVPFLFFLKTLKENLCTVNFTQMLFVKHGRKCILIIPAVVHKLQNITKVFLISAEWTHVFSV